MIDDMRLQPRAIGLVLALLGIQATTIAADDAPKPARHACSVVASDAARLSCYDETYGRPGPSDGPMATEISGAVATPVAAPVATTAIAQASPAPQADPVKDFGLTESQQRARASLPTDAGPSSISAAVTAVENGRDGGFVATLDNGQVWIQSDLATRVSLRRGERISIRKAAMGSHLLISEDRRSVRVRRIR